MRTRYYNPAIGRFINADSLLNGGDELQGYNMYAYCGNNPVNKLDPTGHDWKKTGLTILSAVSIVGGLILCATGVGGIAGGILLGAGAGLGGFLFIAATETANFAAIGLASASIGTSFIGGFIGNFIGSSTTSIIDGKTIDFGRLAFDSTVMGGLNIFAGFMSGISGATSAMGRGESNLNSKVAFRLLSGVIAGGTEATYDIISYIYGRITSNF